MQNLLPVAVLGVKLPIWFSDLNFSCTQNEFLILFEILTSARFITLKNGYLKQLKHGKSKNSGYCKWTTVIRKFDSLWEPTFENKTTTKTSFCQSNQR